MRRVGIIGCGAIASVITEAIEKKIVKCDELVLYDHKQDKADALQKSLSTPTRLVTDLEQMIKLRPRVIVEAASQQAAREYAGRILAEDIDLIVMSVGALLDTNIRSPKLHIPSGAIGGLDAISAAALAGIQSVVLTTRKNPKALEKNNAKEEIVFQGDARKAVELFPKEMNVAAALALTASSEEVVVRVISDPKVLRNVHEVEVKWKHGTMSFRFENDPHPQNPKTSALAAWSAISLLKRLLETDA